MTLEHVTCAIRGHVGRPTALPSAVEQGLLAGPRPPGPTAQWPSSGAPSLGPAEISETAVPRWDAVGAWLRVEGLPRSPPGFGDPTPGLLLY